MNRAQTKRQASNTRAFVAKAVYNYPTNDEGFNRALHTMPNLRKMWI